MSAVAEIKRYVDLLALKRNHPGMELRLSETKAIADCLYRRGPCNFLVFGMGRDSDIWLRLNERGRTVFLEDHEEWFAKSKALNPDMEAYLIKYSTRLFQWKDILGNAERLEMQLPERVTGTAWHVILVDGPKGDPDYHEKYGIHPPGRMQSIYMASELAGPGGDVFVHDCDREIEAVYSDSYLGKENLQRTIKGRSILRHYQMP